MQSVLMKARGLYTYPNTLSEIPEGALTVADNVVIDRNGVIEPRRGFYQYGDSFVVGTDRAKQLLTYKNRILRHYDDILDFDDGTGTFDDFAGTFEETEEGLRIKAVEANGNCYFTTAAGIKRISATDADEFTDDAGYIRTAGVPEALDVTGELDYTTGGYFTRESKVAYRITWAFKDANNNLHEGAASSRLVLVNYAEDDAQTATVNLTFAIPSDIGTTDTQFYYRIYRSQVVQADPPTVEIDDIDPGEEMNLVIEDYPTGGELTARSVTVEDITPEAFRVGGSLLYSNPVSGEGILQSNNAPPVAKDLALFQNTMFYANTQTVQQLDLALLSIGDLISGTSTFTITQGATVNTYKFRGVKERTTVTCIADVAGSLNNDYFFINSASDARQYYVWYNVNAAGIDPAISGRLGIEVAVATGALDTAVASATNTALNDIIDFTATVLGATVTVINANNGNTTNASAQTSGFTVTVTQAGDGEDQATLEVLLSGLTSPSQAIDETARSIVNIINNNPLEIVNAFYISGPDDVPGLLLFKARSLSGAAFSFIANSSLTGEEFSPTLPTSGETVISENEIEPNGLYYSKFQQPEAVPIVNKFNVGPKDKAILRILPLRDSLFVLKEDGIYRVTGQAGTFTLDPFDAGAILIAPDSACVLNNQIYMLSSQGIVTVSDTGVQVISRPIEGIIDRITSNNFDFTYNTFGIPYESDRAYLIWSVTNVNDDQPTQCFRFNTFTNSWTRFPIAKTCGIVNFADDKLYLGAADAAFIEKERKDFLRTDYADREFELTISDVTTETVTLSSIQNVVVGDVLVQTQFLTLIEWNQILKKLDLDPYVTDNDYFELLEGSAGISFRNQINALADKLDADPGVDNTTFASSIGSGTDFEDFQDDYNIIVNLLNTASGVKNINFRESEGTKVFEGLVEEKIRQGNLVVLTTNQSLIAGPVVLVRGIPCDVIWAPQTFGDPSLMKQVREGTFMFEDTVFYSASVGYASDQSPDFEFIDFNESGVGNWGQFTWDNMNWGGGGSQVPIRTYIPRDKQRCRFIRPRFQHVFGREKFALFGLSLSLRSISERAYRS